jgi:murein L,D-transpeptidase YcbB/YkuD
MWSRTLVALICLGVCGGQASASTTPEPLWFRHESLTTAGEALLLELSRAEQRGLRSADYRVQPLPHDSALADAALTRVAGRFASDLSRGRVSPAELGYDLDVPRAPFDEAAAARALASSTDLPSTLDSMEPQLVHFRLLREALARYRAIASARANARMPSPPPHNRVRAGERYEDAPALRQLLRALGDMPASTNESAATDLTLDASLQAGLRNFQSRHGLEPDGVLGRATYSALVVPIDARVKQIELSMERIRWLPQRLGSPPIIVNIPQFRLFAFRTANDLARDILQMDVVVGADFHGRRTPVFAADMRYVVLEPYWDVPRSILLKELLPQISADSDWVARNDYEIVVGQTDAAKPVPVTAQNVALLAQGTLRLRQKPGPTNALGVVKFIFPNRHQVYLHDTPAKALFARSRRAYSHGCIRVADPMALLAHVMRDDPTWTTARRDELLASETPVRIMLPQPIRVFILYGTALATEAGTVMFFDDIYGQDGPLLEKLARAR